MATHELEVVGFQKLNGGGKSPLADYKGSKVRIAHRTEFNEDATEASSDTCPASAGNGESVLPLR
jgi:hypothetical protein